MKRRSLQQFYRQNDPTNSMNPGIGKTSKQKYWGEAANAGLRRIRNNQRQDYSAWRFCITLHAGECLSGRFRSAIMSAEAPLLDSDLEMRSAAR
jgi:hypothetical protein